MTMQQSKPNSELFADYKVELSLGINNERNYIFYCQKLDEFEDYLNGAPPSASLAKKFLSRWRRKAPATFHKYVGIIGGFMKWCGVDLGVKVKVPYIVPEYVSDEDVQKLLAEIRAKKTHKETIERDVLLVLLGYKAGLRRGAKPKLELEDIRFDDKCVVLRKGKGGKEQVVPIPDSLVALLKPYCANLKPGQRLFPVSPGYISDMVRNFARKAGVDIHEHSLRHAYATRLRESGADIMLIKELLGHSELSSTQRYIGLKPEHLRAAVDRLDAVVEDPPNNQVEQAGRRSEEGETHGEKIYTESPHKKEIREMAAELHAEIRLPGVLDLFTGSSTFVAGVTIFQDENYLARQLRLHFESGGFEHLLQKIRDWKSGADDYLAKCSDLLRDVKQMILDTRVAVVPGDALSPGIMLDPFCGTACADAVGTIIGNPTQLVYTTATHFLNPELLILRYGGYGISYGARREELEKHQKLHEETIYSQVKGSVAAELASLKAKLSEIELETPWQLQRFSEMEKLPGHCELCRN